MKINQTMDVAYISHLLASLILLKANGNIVAFLNEGNIQTIGTIGYGYLGIMLISISIVLIATNIIHSKRIELYIMNFAVIAILIIKSEIITILYFSCALILILWWFTFRRNPSVL